MTKRRLILTTLVVGSAIGAAGCGDAQSAARSASATTDLGVIADLSTYQPTKPPGSGGSTSGGGGGSGKAADASAGGDARVQVAELAADLRKKVDEAKVDAALQLFVAEHVATLGDEPQSAFLQTMESVDVLQRVVSGKFDPAKTTAIMNAFKGFPADAVTVEVLDAEHATISPNLAGLIFGPAKTTPALKAVQKEGKWLFQLEAPLTEDDAKTIIAYHSELKSVLDKVMTAIESGAPNDATLIAMLTDARLGKPVTIPDGGAAAPAGDGEKKEAGDGEKPAPEGEGEGEGGKGRVRSPKTPPPEDEPPKEDNP